MRRPHRGLWEALVCLQAPTIAQLQLGQARDRIPITGVRRGETPSIGDERLRIGLGRSRVRPDACRVIAWTD
jgi:hypothetical protein